MPHPSRSHPRMPEPEQPVPVVCASSYAADLAPAQAFVFRVPSTDTRFTVYSSDPNRYLISGSYLLILADPGQLPLWLVPEDWAFLRHCLTLVEQQWQQATEQTQAAAQRPRTDEPPSPGHMNVEPTPAGYAAIAARFHAEHDRVRELRQRIDEIARAADNPEQE